MGDGERQLVLTLRGWTSGVGDEGRLVVSWQGFPIVYL